MNGGDSVFARSVRHPGSKIPARPFLPLDGNGRLQRGAEQRLMEVAIDALRRGMK